MDVYHDKATQIYVDNFGSARTEMKTLTAPIVGEVGDIINQVKPTPTSGITIFHSMGKIYDFLFLSILQLIFVHFSSQEWPSKMPLLPKQFLKNI